MTHSPCTRLSSVDLIAPLDDCCTSCFQSVADIRLTPAACTDQYTNREKTILSIVSMSGLEQGYLAMVCPESLLEQLTTTVLGAELAAEDNYSTTVLGELSHTIAETMLDSTNNRSCYKLSTPMVFEGAPELLQQLVRDHRGITRFFCHNKQQVIVKYTLLPDECLASASLRKSNGVQSVNQAYRLFHCPQTSETCHCRQSSNRDTAVECPSSC